jgi:germination protein M
VTRLAPLVALLVLFVAAGCGDGNETVTVTETETVTQAETTTEPATTTIRVYWLRDGKVWPHAREVEAPGTADAAITELFDGPNAQEQDDLDVTTTIPDGAEVEDLEIENGVARLQLTSPLPETALAQVVYTLTQFPTVKSVDTQARILTRADFEDFTPAILVESPLPFEEVESPLRATGTANTFEADFQYELTDTDGRIVDENFVRATSGTGTRGTFDFTTAEFTVPFDGVGSLIVFESSAKDGSRINVVEIPLRMVK